MEFLDHLALPASLIFAAMMIAIGTAILELQD
jgi:hypothetical protein